MILPVALLASKTASIPVLSLVELVPSVLTAPETTARVRTFGGWNHLS